MASIKWIKANDYNEMSEIAANIVEQQLKEKPTTVLGLPTGSTPIGMYQKLVERNKTGNLSFKDVTTFNLDEYIGVAPSHPTSYHYFMNEQLFNSIDIKRENIHIPKGYNVNVEQYCHTYEEDIIQAGGLDLMLLGIGVNGHIGFNEPGTPFNSKTQIVELTSSTREANSVHFENPADVPTKAITMGIDTILQAKKIVLLISGSAKLEAINRLQSGEISEEFPASALHQHDDVTVIYTL